MSIQVRIKESVHRHALCTVKREVFHPEVFVQYKGGEGQSNTTIEIAKYIV
jgi:hypothetical protein